LAAHHFPLPPASLGLSEPFAVFLFADQAAAPLAAAL